MGIPSKTASNDRRVVGDAAADLIRCMGLTLAQAEAIPDDPWVFVRDCVWTQDEHQAQKGLPAIRPLIDSDTKATLGHRDFSKYDWYCYETDGIDPESEDAYLLFLTRQWQKRGKQQWKKSRQLRVTWLLAALNLWEALKFKGIKTGYQSKKFEDADAYLRDRFWFIYEHIPAKYLKPRARYISGVIEVFHEEDTVVPTSQIMALAEGANQVRQFTFSRLWRDEAAFQTDQKESHGASQPSLEGGGSDLKTSSSNGTRTFFYELAESDVAPGPQTDKRTVFTGVTAWERNGYQHLFIHYSADGKKRPGTTKGDEWLPRAKAGQPTDQWRREMEGEDSVEPGSPVFCDTERVEFIIQEVRGWLRFFGTWDFGYQWPFSYVFQIEPIENPETRKKDLILHVLREFVRPNTEIYEFGLWVKAERERIFGKRKWTDYGDDAGRQHSDKGVSIETLQSLGITVLSQPTGPGGIRKRNILFQRLISGRCVQIDPQCKFLKTAIESGYIRDDDGDAIGGEDGHPYADAVDSLCYGLVNVLGLEHQIDGHRERTHSTLSLPTAQPTLGGREDANNKPGSPLTRVGGSPIKPAVHTQKVFVPQKWNPRKPLKKGV